MLQGKGAATLPDQTHFYLTGGTVLAEFYLGHRLSFDLDFFTAEDALILPVSYQIEVVAPRYDLQVSVVRRFATFRKCGTVDKPGLRDVERDQADANSIARYPF